MPKDKKRKTKKMCYFRLLEADANKLLAFRSEYNNDGKGYDVLLIDTEIVNLGMEEFKKKYQHPRDLKKEDR